MGMVASREIRWFVVHTDETTRILTEWIEKRDPFDANGRIRKEEIWKGRLEDRADIYALVPGADDMGIKWREGEFQIKGRREDIGVQVFDNGASGRVEQWLKWSYKGTDVDASFLPWFDVTAEQDPRKPLQKPELIHVHKIRALRKIRIDGREQLAEVPPKELVDRAVNVELTELKIDDTSFWSIGVEAFPDDSNMAAAFYEVTRKFLSQLQGIHLDSSNSFSYPVWLSRIAEKGVHEVLADLDTCQREGSVEVHTTV